jgi:ubiquinone biosynthesis protein UbiJ
MGIARDIRKRIEGHQRIIATHEAKIRTEQAKPYPNEARIELWRKQIANAQAQIEKLERRLQRRRR